MDLETFRVSSCVNVIEAFVTSINPSAPSEMIGQTVAIICDAVVNVMGTHCDPELAVLMRAYARMRHEGKNSLEDFDRAVALLSKST